MLCGIDDMAVRRWDRRRSRGVRGPRRLCARTVLCRCTSGAGGAGSRAAHEKTAPTVALATLARAPSEREQIEQMDRWWTGVGDGGHVCAAATAAGGDAYKRRTLFRRLEMKRARPHT
jgi:hypothetical protein